MKKKIGKRISALVSMVLVLTMLVGTGSVWAKEKIDNKCAEYVITYSSQEITDVDSIISLAEEQKKVQVDNSYMIALKDKNFDEDNSHSLSYYQLLETRHYKDGHKENDYILSQIVMYDEEMNPISTKDYSTFSSRLDQQTGGGYGVAVMQQFSYTFSYDANWQNTFTLHYNRAKVIQKDFWKSVNIRLFYTYMEDVGIEDDVYYGTFTNVTTGVWYNWNLNNVTYTVHNFWGGVGAGAIYTVNVFGSFETCITAQEIL